MNEATETKEKETRAAVRVQHHHHGGGVMGSFCFDFGLDWNGMTTVLFEIFFWKDPSQEMNGPADTRHKQLPSTDCLKRAARRQRLTGVQNTPNFGRQACIDICFPN